MNTKQSPFEIVEKYRSELHTFERKVNSQSNRLPLLHGVSVITPSYRSVDTLGETLRSLAAQTLAKDEFEIIVVLNGEDDGTRSMLHSLASDLGEVTIRIIENSRSSAGAARNLALKLARFDHVTFVDADDLVAPRFLETMLQSAEEGASIVASPIVNLDSDGNFDAENSLNQRIMENSGKTLPLAAVPWLLGFNACKLVPTSLVSALNYREDLPSGEDLVFFANLLADSELKAVFPENADQAEYIRRLKDNSVSRQTESFEFNVRQRVMCIQALRDIDVPLETLPARVALERAQASFVRRYLENHVTEVEKLEQLLGDIAFVDFPWSWLNEGKARDLAISYCFLPYADTSAVVAAKALAERKKVVDVISADMSELRKTDSSLNFLASRWIENQFEVSVKPSFSDWGLNVLFAKKAADISRTRQNLRGFAYETLYTRALWMGSHIAGSFLKLEQPEIQWTAEFSDPLRFGVDGSPRVGGFEMDEDAETLLSIIESRSPVELVVESIFDLVEMSTMLLADELLFTNENQMEFMLSKYPPEMAALVAEKARVRQHPSPSADAYRVVESSPPFDPRKINIAYFGAFYVNRGLGDVFTALVNSSVEVRERVNLHVFCNDPVKAQVEMDSMGLSGIAFAHEYLPYMEFLNATTKADVLVVNDITRSPGLQINPFLPSKYSDYKGSGCSVWGIIDTGSPLSTKPLDFVSYTGNAPSAVKVLNQIVKNHE